MADKVRLNSLKPTFTFTRDGEPIAIEALPNDALDKVQSVLYEDIKNVPQEITVEIGGKNGFVYSNYIQKPKPIPKQTIAEPDKSNVKKEALQKGEMLNAQEDVDI